MMLMYVLKTIKDGLKSDHDMPVKAESLSAD